MLILHPPQECGGLLACGLEWKEFFHALPLPAISLADEATNDRHHLCALTRIPVAAASWSAPVLWSFPGWGGEAKRRRNCPRRAHATLKAVEDNRNPRRCRAFGGLGGSAGKFAVALCLPLRVPLETSILQSQRGSGSNPGCQIVSLHFWRRVRCVCVRGGRGCVCAGGCGWAWPRPVHLGRCIRWRAPGKSAAAG